MRRASRLSPFVLLPLLAAPWAAAQVPGWDPRWPSVDAMLHGHDPALVREFRERSAQIARNPSDVAALNRRGYVCSELSHSGLYRVFWRWLAAKDLEQVVKLDPNHFYAWRYYVERSATSDADCKRYVGTWSQGECRVSMALYPGPDQPWEGHT